MVMLHGHGVLADLAPWPVDIDARTVRDAICGLASQLPDLRRTLIEGHWHVLRDGMCMDTETIDLPPGQEVHIVPEAMGEGGGNSGTFALIGIGVVLVGASLFVPGSTTLVAAGYSASFASAAGAAATVAFTIGLSLTLAGVSQLLTPDPPEQDNTGGSTLMGGVVNTTSSDAVVPILFGRGLVGSVVTSSGQSTIQLI